MTAGSTAAFTAAIESLACLDGGNLEDAQIAIGVALFRHERRLGPRLMATNLGKYGAEAPI